MPELLSLDDDDRREWLRSYRQTWLERDLSDLTRLSDLLPFRTLQRIAMLRSGQLLNYAELGRDAALSAATGAVTSSSCACPTRSCCCSRTPGT